MVERIFLVVIDATEEHHKALRFASLRAKRTGGRVALLYVIEPAEFKHWMAVEDIMRQERREEAEALLHEVSADVQELSGKTPVYFLREGNLADELLDLINEEKGISILVLAAAAGKKGAALQHGEARKKLQRRRVGCLFGLNEHLSAP